MKRKTTVLVLNLITALSFVLLSLAAARANFQHNRLTYSHLLYGTPTNDLPFELQWTLRTDFTADSWFALLGLGAAGACIINGLVFFYCRQK